MSETVAFGVPISTIFPDPRTAGLAGAVVDGDAARVRELARGADLSVRGDRDVTLLQWAVFNRNLPALRELLDAGADPAQPGMDGDTVLHLAAMADEPAYLSELLRRGASPDLRNATTGAGVLRSALIGDRQAQFRMLLVAGADPNLADRMGNTPLHVAALVNEPARVLDLLADGADAARRNAQGVTFQHYLFTTRLDLLDAPTSAAWERVLDWLQAHGIPLEAAQA